MKPDKATDIYNILPAMTKYNHETLAPIITTAFNNSINKQIYPSTLKLTRIAAIFKNKDKTLPENYRPISILPIIAKIFDTLINDQLISHLLTNNILSKYQYAFRPQSDTTLTLTTIIDHILLEQSKKHHTLAIFIDMTKAYDTVSHSKLLHKLKHIYNFDPPTLALFTSYFTNHQQTTHTPHAKSKHQTITHGIPQGSTLSTTLFILYINDIHSPTTHSITYIYADDITLIISAPNLETLTLHA
jgi:hypothetical protein